MSGWFTDNIRKVRESAVDAFQRYSPLTAVSLLGAFLYQAAVFVVLRKIRKGVVVQLLSSYTLLSRHLLKVNFELADKNYTRQFVDTETDAEFNLEPLSTDGEGLTILVSSEPDHRYEWLEHAIEREELDATVVYMPNWIFQWVTEYYLGEYETAKWGFDDSHPEFETDRQRLVECLDFILRRIIELYDPDVFLSASLGDIRWRETITAARQLDVPWVVTEREGVLVDAVRKRFPPKVRKSFLRDIDQMTVSNQTHYEHWREIGLEDDQLTITGDLKSDVWENRSLCRGRSEIHPWLDEDRTLLLYFSFGPKSYINKDMFPDLDDTWAALRQTQFEVLDGIAAEFADDTQIVIKGGHTDDLVGVNIVDNENVLHLGSQYSALELIINADVIVGFQTTAMIESMFTTTPIIYPGWGELHDSVIDEVIPLHETAAITQASSRTEFEELLRSHLESPSSTVGEEAMAAREEFRSEYYYHVGSVAERTYAALEELVETEG